MEQELTARIKNVLSQVLNVDVGRIERSSRFSDLTTIDSLTVAELASGLDEEFQIRVPTDSMASAETVDDLVRIVGELVTPASA